MEDILGQILGILAMITGILICGIPMLLALISPIIDKIPCKKDRIDEREKDVQRKEESLKYEKEELEKKIAKFEQERKDYINARNAITTTPPTPPKHNNSECSSDEVAKLRAKALSAETKALNLEIENHRLRIKLKNIEDEHKEFQQDTRVSPDKQTAELEEESRPCETTIESPGQERTQDYSEFLKENGQLKTRVRDLEDRNRALQIEIADLHLEINSSINNIQSTEESEDLSKESDEIQAARESLLSFVSDSTRNATYLFHFKTPDWFLDPKKAGSYVRAVSQNFSFIRPVSVSADIHSESSGEDYRTTLTSCNCQAFNRGHVPCKHMIWLALQLGALSFRKAEHQQIIDSIAKNINNSNKQSAKQKKK